MTGATLHVVIPGICPPSPRPRARVVPAGAGKRPFAQIYVPREQGYREFQRAASVAMVQESRVCGFAVDESPVEVWLLFVMPLPKSSERKTLHVVRDWCRSNRRGDVDNLAKGPLDAAKGVLWADDRQVVSLHCEKIIGEQGEAPRTEMMIRRLERADSHRTEFEAIREARRESGELYGPRIPEGTPWTRTGQEALPL